MVCLQCVIVDWFSHLAFVGYITHSYIFLLQSFSSNDRIVFQEENLARKEPFLFFNDLDFLPGNIVFKFITQAPMHVLH